MEEMMRLGVMEMMRPGVMDMMVTLMGAKSVARDNELTTKGKDTIYEMAE